MILTPQDARRFYATWFPLLYFVNQRRRLVHDFPSAYEPVRGMPNGTAKLRDALWADDTLREAFIAENPAGLGPTELALVASWKTRVSADFYFFRQFSKYAILISDEEIPRVYGVLGPTASVESSVLIKPPCLQRTTLLPFEGKIIYDGLLVGYNISFGPSVRARLNEAYLMAQERGTLLTSLEVASGNDIDTIRERNTRLLSMFQQHITPGRMRSEQTEDHRNTIATFGEDYLLKHEKPRALIELTAEDLAIYLGNMGDDVNLESFKLFVHFLHDTERISKENAETMLDELR